MIINPDKLLAFIDGAGLSYKENSRSYVFSCPRCHKDQKLYIEKRSGRFICFSCSGTDGFRGKPEFALAELALTSVREVREFLYGADQASTADPLDLELANFFGDEDVIDVDAVDVPEVSFPYDYYPIDHEFSKRGADYLAGRGIGLELARAYGLRYATVKRRVVFPVELGSKLVGWQERLVIPDRNWDEEQEKFVGGAKMLSSKDVPTAQVVMFANRLIGSNHAVICEGPIDAIKAHLCGGNVATMGKAVSVGQMRTIRDPARLTRQQVGVLQNSGIQKIYLALDPDAARETSRLVREFSDLEVFVMRPPRGYKDLGEMSCEQVLEIFQSAERATATRMFVHFGGH